MPAPCAATSAATSAAPSAAGGLVAASKRRKLQQVQLPQLMGGSQYVLVSGIDEPDKPVEIDLSLLEHFHCRLYLTIKHSQPGRTSDGRDFWRSGLTKALLITLVRSLTVGELVLSKGVAVGEALAMFNQECVSVGKQRGEHACIDKPRAGLAFAKRPGSALERVQALCETVADAIVSWPRLETDLHHALAGNHSALAVSSTRAWLRFCEKPKHTVSARPSDTSQLVRKSPPWLTSGLLYMGVAHTQLAAARPELASVRDEGAFNLLCAQIDDDALGNFGAIRVDAVRSQCDARLRKELHRAERFANEVRTTIIEAAQSADDSAPLLAVQYARAVVTYVENALLTAPACASIFSAVCSDENGNTPERAALKKALKARNVSIVRWQEERELGTRYTVFPPWFSQSQNSHAGPAVLLNFETLLS